MFSPASVTIHKGETVHWVDADSTPHNIVGQGAAASIINRSAINTEPYTVKFTHNPAPSTTCARSIPVMVGVIKVT